MTADLLLWEPRVVHAYQTPGTTLGWSDLGEWVHLAYHLHVPNQRACARTYERQELHWEALPDEVVLGADQGDLAGFIHLLGGWEGPWGKPRRGHRGGSRWERLNVMARNRLWKLRRDAEWDSIPAGHNSGNHAPL